jgi:K+-transporting ATPase ATPase C chain
MKDILTTLRLVILSLIVCCVLYPAVLLAFGQIVVPWKANGSLIRHDTGTILGSAQLAQAFTQPRYFWPRPSAVDYDASATGGSNLSPRHPLLAQRAQALIGRYGLRAGQRIPADLVAASGSGMDPHITLAAARFQAPRVASARHLPLERVYQLIEQNTDVPTLRVFGGEPVVNVLRLNIALDVQSRLNPLDVQSRYIESSHDG